MPRSGIESEDIEAYLKTDVELSNKIHTELSNRLQVDMSRVKHPFKSPAEAIEIHNNKRWDMNAMLKDVVEKEMYKSIYLAKSVDAKEPTAPCPHHRVEYWNHGYHNRCTDCGKYDVLIDWSTRKNSGNSGKFGTDDFEL